MSIVRDENTSTDALAIVEKYEAFVNYLYPILQNSPRRHGILRDAVLAALFVPKLTGRFDEEVWLFVGMAGNGEAAA